MSATIHVGTSGWSYPEGAGTWNGIFYPPRGTRGFRAADELRYYSEHFDTVEVNSTFYRPPSAVTTRRWAEHTPPGFEFSVKLYQKFTHAGMIGRGRGLDRTPKAAGATAPLPSPTPADADEFRAALDPLASAGKLGPLLAQFPAGFRATPETREYLADLLLDFRDYPLAVELRHKSWSDDSARTAALLNEVGAAWVQIDEPKFRFSIRQDFAANTPGCYYLRLHGRNAAQWWRHDSPDDRYNYLYTPSELKPFADTMSEVSTGVRKAYLYLNNHFAAKAVVNATILKHQLGMAVEGEFRRELVERYPELKGIVRTAGSLL
jgi:uncharacterized protein YecE (DUF72 family)